MYLCCDLGGTNARFAVFSPANKSFVFSRKKKNRDFENFYVLLKEILEEYKKFDVNGCAITNTTLGVAGPTTMKEVRPTNLDAWDINVETVADILRDYGHDPFASILNDFEALGYGVLYLYENGFEKEDFEPVYGRFRAGAATPGQEVGTRSLVCGPGTGLGVSCIIEGLKRENLPYIATSEAGHHSLAPETVDQYRFLGNLDKLQFQGKRSYEEALSGPGLRNIYNFYRRADYNEDSNDSIAPEEIVQASNRGDQAATDAVEFFCEALAGFCGNLALTFNCDRSIFLWGSTLNDISPDLLKNRFARHFADRCKHSERVSGVSVVLVKNQSLPLLGCAHRSQFEDLYLKGTGE